MKPVHPEFLSLLNTDRIIGATSVIRNNRLTFDLGTAIPTNKQVDEYYATDLDVYDNGVLRVAVGFASIYRLYFQYINPFDDPATWDDWTMTSVSVYQNSRPGVFGNRIFYVNTNGQYQYRDYIKVGNYLSSATTFDTHVDAKRKGFAPVSATEVYAIEIDTSNENGHYAKIVYYKDVNSSVIETQCPRIIYGDMTEAYYNFGFDAYISPDTGLRSIYFSSGKYGNRIDHITHDGTYWSPIQPVLDLDVTESETKFLMNSVSDISNYVFVCMDFIRDSGGDPIPYNGGDENDLDLRYFGGGNFRGYSVGPAPFSLGRNAYICDSNYTDMSTWRPDGKMCRVRDTDYVFSDLYKIFYMNMETIYIADDIQLTGGSSSKSMNAIDDVAIDTTLNNPSGLQLYIGGSSKEEPMVEPGNEIEIYARIGDPEKNYETTILGTFGIDTVMTDLRADGQSKTISGRGLGFKQLSTWTSDAYYDIWSQTKQHCNPSTLTEVIRLSGQWEESEFVYSIKLTELNEPGILYSAEMSSRNNIGAACFYKPLEAFFNPIYGVLSNVYRHPSTDEDTSLVYSAFAGLIEGTTAKLYRVYMNEWTLITSTPVSIAPETWIWLRIIFIDGLVSMEMRQSDDTEWTEIIAPVEFTGDYQPLDGSPSLKGRPGIFIHNITPYANTTGFNTNDMIIPVDDSSPFLLFPTTVVVDDEQINVSAHGSTATGSGWARYYYAGQTFMNAPHSNSNWINGVILSIPGGQVEADQDLCKLSTNKVLTWSIRPGGVITADAVQVKVKKVGSPTGKLYAYICTDDWDESVAINWSAVLAHGEISASAISTEYEWVTITFGSPASNLPIDNYFLAITNCDDHGTPTANASNYYVVAMDEYTPYAEGYTFLWSGPGFYNRMPNGKPLYKLMGEGNGGDGFEIYLDNTATNLARNYFDNNALIVTDGPGKGSVFKITDYDYQAPAQWVPSKYYVTPDRWQDHVGDPEHGSWVNPDAHRIFVETDPRGAIGEGSVMAIKGSLIVSQRGVNTTNATSHGAEKVSYYTDLSVYCNGFEYYSMDTDKRICDVAKDICNKSGVKYFSDEKICDYSLPLNITYDALTDFVDHRNFIIRAKCPIDINPTALYIAYHFSVDDPIDHVLADFYNGRVIKITQNFIEVFRWDDPTIGLSYNDLIARYTIPVPPSQSLYTISVQDKYISIWYLDDLVFAWYDEQPYGDGSFAWLIGYSELFGTNFFVDWSSCDRRVDNFTLDQGTRGAQLMSSLIGKKRIFIKDKFNGGIELFTSTTQIEDEVYNLTATAGTGLVELDLASRVRVQGLYDKEIKNSEAMRLYGNIYVETNNEDIETEMEGIHDANQTLNELIRRRGKYALTGAAHPRLEPRDIITFSDGTNNHTILIDSVAFSISLSGDTPTFDMRLEAINA